MADKIISYGASQGFGAFAGWNSQGTTPATSKQRALAHSAKGDVVADKLFDEKQEVTSRYECNNDTNTVPTEIGALVNALILTSIAFDTKPDGAATMALTGHNHTNNAHAITPALRKVAHAITVPKAFGVVDFLGDTAGTNDSPISGSVTISCEHADQEDKDGDHLVGENFDTKIEAKTTYCGAHVVVAAGFDVTEYSDPDEATGFVKKEVSGIKNMAMT